MEELHQSACTTGILPTLHHLMERQVTPFCVTMMHMPPYFRCKNDVQRTNLPNLNHTYTNLPFAPPSPHQHQNSSGPQAQPLCNFQYITRQGKKRTRAAKVVCRRVASECKYHRKPPEPPPDAAPGNLLLAKPFSVRPFCVRMIYHFTCIGNLTNLTRGSLQLQIHTKRHKRFGHMCKHCSQV